MGAELGHHLGYACGAAKPWDESDQRNDRNSGTVLTGEGALRIVVPRDHEGSFEPVLIPKHERRFTGFDDKIITMYARGMTLREVQGLLLESYGVEVSADRECAPRCLPRCPQAPSSRSQTNASR